MSESSGAEPGEGDNSRKPMPRTLAGEMRDSYRLCRHITRRRARNFYYGIQLLPAERRDGLSAVYAFFRICDDIADGEGGGDRRRELERWRTYLDPAVNRRLHPILPAFHDTLERYAIPTLYFSQLIDGALMDLEPREYETFGEVYRYCYLVAATVGLVCLHIFGYDGEESTRRMAEERGIAFQLTNILRDVAEDARRGRVYLPTEDLRRFGVSRGALLAGVPEEGFEALVRFECSRAREYYRSSAPLEGRIDPCSRPSMAAMTGIYRGLLEKIERRGRSILRARTRLTSLEKVLVATRSWMGTR